MIKLPGRLFLPGEEPCGLNKRINKYCQLTVVKDVKDHLGDDFKKLQDSFLRPVIQMSEIKDLEFSRHLVNLLVQRRIMVESKELWFAIGQQPMRFSLRDFYLITHLPCRLGEAETEAEKSLKLNMKDPMNFKEDPWMTQGHTTKSLLKYLEDHKSNLTSDQKVRLGATILVQAILIADNKVNQVSIEVHWRAQKFEEFCGLPWGNYSFEALVNSVKTVTLEHLKCEQYNFAGFGYALQFWALSCVPQMGLVFGVPNPNIEFPLCLHWQKTRSPMETEVKSFLDDEKVVVKQVIGDPNQYADLVEDLDSKLQKLIELVNQGYRVKSKDWSIGKVNIKAAMEGIKKNEDSVSKDELINCLTHTVLVLEKRVKTLEKILKEKEDNDVTLMSFFNSQRGRNKKTKVVTENEDSHEQRRGVATPGQSSKSQEVLVGENEGENDEEAEEGATSAEEMVEEQDDEAEKETGDESSKHVVSQHENENENAPEQTGVAAPGQSSKPQDVLVSEIEGENDEEVEEGAYNGSKEQDPGNAADDENIQSAGVDEEDNTEKLEGEEGTQKLGDEVITRESEGIDITGENGETANESSKHQEVQEEGQNDEEAEEEDAPAKDMEEDAPAKDMEDNEKEEDKIGGESNKIIGSPLTKEDVEKKMQETGQHPIYAPYVEDSKLQLDKWKQSTNRRYLYHNELSERGKEIANCSNLAPEGSLQTNLDETKSKKRNTNETAVATASRRYDVDESQELCGKLQVEAVASESCGVEKRDELEAAKGQDLENGEKAAGFVKIDQEKDLDSTVELRDGNSKQGVDKVEVKTKKRKREEARNEVLPRCSCQGQRARKLVVFDLNGIFADIVYDYKGPLIPDCRISGRSVFRRPFVDSFLNFCFERFDVGIWSSRRIGLDHMTEFVMGKHVQNLLFIFDQVSCTRTNFNTLEKSSKPLFLKDLKNVWNHFGSCLNCGKQKYDETNTLLVDDSPHKALCNPPYTGIFPHPYQYTDREDSALGPNGELRKYMERLADADNIQNFVEENPFGQTAINEKHESWEFYSKVFKAYK